MSVWAKKRFAMVLRALVTLLVTTAPEALGQPLLTSPLLAVIHEDAACDKVFVSAIAMHNPGRY